MTDESLRFLIEHCPIGLSRHLRSGEFVAASPACASIFGCAPQELVGKELPSLVHSSDKDLLADEWTRVCASEPGRPVRVRYIRPNGEAIWIEATLRAVWNRAADEPSVPGQPSELQVLCCTRDITKEHAAEQARAERLAQAELAERHRDYLVRLTPGLVWFGPVSPDLSSYRAIYISEYLFRVTGYSAKQWLETPGFWASIIHPEDRDHILATAPAAMKEGRALGPYRIFASDGRTLWIQSQMALERDASGVPIRMYGLTLDMTAFQQAQQERMALQERLAEQAQRLLELSTPLIPISEDVLVMPLIGTLDPARAQHALETLLKRVTALRVRYVLVDLTGVSIVDTVGIIALVRMAGAVRLLGAQVILTGMRADIARSMIELPTELGEVTTRPSLRAAIVEFVTSHKKDGRPGKTPNLSPG